MLAGIFLPTGRERDALTRTLAAKSCLPVFLDAKTIDLYYNGFCNSVLWSLFHYVPLQTDSRLSETRTLQFQWDAYQEANRRFAEVLLKQHRPGDVVWVQDYHLMMLPALLKAKAPDMKVRRLCPEPCTFF